VPKFNNRDGVRGVVVRKSGLIALINDSQSF